MILTSKKTHALRDRETVHFCGHIEADKEGFANATVMKDPIEPERTFFLSFGPEDLKALKRIVADLDEAAITKKKRAK